MPLVRIDVLEGRPEEELRELADVVQEVMEEVFVAPERDRYQIIHEHRPGRMITEDTGLGFRRTEDLVIIQVTQQGRAEDQKKALYARLADRLSKGSTMDKLLKASLALGVTALAAGGLKRVTSSEPRYAPWEKPDFEDFEHRILILGGGFAGYNAATRLCESIREREDAGVMVIDQHNYLTFWPLLAGVISRGVSVRNIAQPLRWPLIRMGASFQGAWIDNAGLQRQIVTADGKEFPYDHLVLALGAQTAYFGIPGVQADVCGDWGWCDGGGRNRHPVARVDPRGIES